MPCPCRSGPGEGTGRAASQRPWHRPGAIGLRRVPRPAWRAISARLWAGDGLTAPQDFAPRRRPGRNRRRIQGLRSWPCRIRLARQTPARRAACLRVALAQGLGHVDGSMAVHGCPRGARAAALVRAAVCRVTRRRALNALSARTRAERDRACCSLRLVISKGSGVRRAGFAAAAALSAGVALARQTSPRRGLSPTGPRPVGDCALFGTNCRRTGGKPLAAKRRQPSGRRCAPSVAVHSPGCGSFVIRWQHAGLACRGRIAAEGRRLPRGRTARRRTQRTAGACPEAQSAVGGAGTSRLSPPLTVAS